MKNTKLSLLGAVGLALAAAGCGGGSGHEVDDFTSGVSTLLDFEFDGELVTNMSTNPRGQVRAQLLYTVGHFNAERGVSRLAAVTLTGITTTSLGGGLYRVRYHAKLPVAWGSKQNLPTSYVVTLPKRVDTTGQATFEGKYAPTCNDGEGADINPSNFWYHYRPAAAGCSFAAADVTRSTAKVTVSPLNGDTKYPEYHRIWEDGSLDVVAVFGKYAKGATSNDDAGIEAYNSFVTALREAFPGAATTPMNVTDQPGAAMPDITFEATLDDGRTVNIVTLLVDEVQSAPASFDSRFAELTPGADLILYDGHAGLGANVRALTAKARFFPGKYQLFFMNGCDTFAYEDDSLVSARAALNPDDPTGSRYMDVMRNAMPAYFSSMPDASMAVLGALVDEAAPKKYAEIFKGIDEAQDVVVVGEEDNVFSPSFAPGKRWAGLEENGTVGYKQTVSYVSEQLPAGKYVFEMTPDPSSPGGDADLYLKVGSAPTATSTYKCPSYKWNSNERCKVTLGAPAKVFFQATGDSQKLAPFVIRGFQSY